MKIEKLIKKSVFELIFSRNLWGLISYGSYFAQSERLLWDLRLKNCFLSRTTNPRLNKLTPEEKKQIVTAMNLKPGHWHKCPQGHIYVITECGGAMEKSKCPDCGAVIGGENHKLAQDNQLATEMDGARYSAWSEQANLANYGNLDEIV